MISFDEKTNADDNYNQTNIIVSSPYYLNSISELDECTDSSFTFVKAKGKYSKHKEFFAKGISYKEAFLRAKKVGADAFLLFDDNPEELRLSTRYKRRYKFLDDGQIAILYLSYLLKNNESKDKKVISVTSDTTDLIRKIAEKNNVEVDISFDGKKSSGKPRKEYFLELLGDKICKPDLLDVENWKLCELSNMIDYYKQNGLLPIEIIEDIYRTFGIHRTSTNWKNIPEGSSAGFFKRLSKTKKGKIGDKNITKSEEFCDNQRKFWKISLDNGSWVIFYDDKDKKAVKYKIQIVGSEKQKLMDIVSFEKDVESWIEDNTESLKKRTFSWKTVIKYLIFISLVIGIFLVVFFTIYSGSQSVQGTTNLSSYSIASLIYNSQNRLIWMTLWLWRLVVAAIGAWATKRSLKMQDQESRMIDLYVASIMSSIVSFLTPFMVGGDAVAYWYMRRRGVKRSALITSYMTDTLLNQGKFFLQTIILFSIGIGMYKQIFISGDPQAHAALVMFFIGISWMIFSTAMIFIILLNRRIQEFIVRNTVRFLEWTRFWVVIDPGKLSSSTMYEFKMIREGTKLIWKHKVYPFEMIIYALIPLFLNPGAIILHSGGWINNNLPSGWYLGQLVANDIIGVANSMSITPGGSGTGEWLSVNVNHIIFDNSQQINEGLTASATEVASGNDFMWKIFFGWPDLAFSGLLTCLMIFVENRRGIIKDINKNRAMNNKAVRKPTKSLKVAISICGLYFILLIIYNLVLIF